MKSKIKVMPPDLAAKIAAGEVVERPASVVKELVENSLDAGAADISIHIVDGGKKLIRVYDNGEGMSREDAVLAFERHATSKILKDDDLCSISTMGFRGEALPSIASVSDAMVATKVAGEIAGTRIRVRGGKIEDISDFGCPDGTTVEVRDIFFNVPARLKFLRSNAAEMGRIQDVVHHLSLANPDIRFKLTHGKNILLNASANSDLKTRACDILGTDIMRGVIPVEGNGGGVSVMGFVSNSNITYPTTKGVFVFVNKRWIRDKGINYAILQAYKNMLMRDRYPLAVLFISLPPEDVDVNVHPAKTEVRFKNPRFIYDVISDAIRNAILQKNKDYPDGTVTALHTSVPQDRIREPAIHYQTQDIADRQAALFEKAFHGTNGISFPELNFVGQLWDEYIICNDESMFYIIDQHAAAERIAFERIRKEYYSYGIRGQILLVPEIIEVSAAEKEALDSSIDVIKDLGFEIEQFGGNTFILKAVPEILSGRGCSGLLKDMTEEICSFGKAARIEDAIDAILVKLACHSVIRGRRKLTRDEVVSLFKQLSEVDFASNCPHGRPVVKMFSKTEIETMLKRR
ncbi:MAG: hypothetical protein A2073_04350 [Deltaproteobacteria bacterium GWC2_42_11]|nr:MAG: hypothetical protein A2073_04350 [Deltaproteobacteria bacterium GWC2_42_11]